jgi:hypothetical protein
MLIMSLQDFIQPKSKILFNLNQRFYSTEIKTYSILTGFYST